jgi:polyhydroxybutyrate depolymerase
MPEMDFDGRTRNYRLHVPEGIGSKGPVPLVFMFHGGGGTGKHIARITGINACADKEGFIACCPDGLERHWNDGRHVADRIASAESVDDVGFVLALIDQISGEHAIDGRRVYVAGASNGAMLCWRLAFEVPDRVAAVAGIMCPLHDALVQDGAPPKGPIPILMMHGTEDPVVPYKGGDMILQGKVRGTVVSVTDTVRYWCELNECAAIPEEDLIADVTDENPMRVWREIYDHGKEDTEVILYTIHGGGHTWPGGEQYAPVSLIGPTCKAYSATDHIWTFFQRHGKN